MPKRTLSGGKVSADIRAGLGYKELMLTYGLSTAQLDVVFKQLSAAGYINEADVLSPGEDLAHKTLPPPTSSPAHNHASVAKDKDAPEIAPVTPAQRSKQPDDPNTVERYKSFRPAFPDFGMDEFELVNDDLYPDCKRSVSRDGTWEDFLLMYRDFIKWYEDKGSSGEPGFKLWRVFLDSPGTRA